MDNIGSNIRLFLWVTFLALAWLTYTTWTNEHAPPPPAAPGAATGDPAAVPVSAGTETLPPLGAPDNAAQPGATPTAAPPATPARSDLIRVRTDVLDVLIDLHGGDLVQADLPHYPVEKHQPDTFVRLLDSAPDKRWVFQTGIQGAEGTSAPDHTATFRSASADYVLADGQDALTVTLDWAGDGPVAAQKVYTFQRGRYAIDLALKASAPGGGRWLGAPYAQMRRLYAPVKRSYTSVDSYSFWGPVLFNGSNYEKLDFEDLAETPVTQTVKGGWFAAIQHHFLAAAVPPAGDDVLYRAAAAGPDFVLTARGSPQNVETSTPLDYRFTLFVGPKLQDQLAAAGPKLERAVDYGFLTVLAQPLFWLLSKVEIYVNNWGWAIVLVTIMIKLVFYKLTAMSGRSMAKMRRLAPRMKALQERYKEDRQALSAAMMELYKKEKVNPAAGCLPMLIQMPFFFAFYWVLVESVEMRQAPFALWIDDLSVRDPFYVLPLLMGVAMFFQTRMSPAPPDPMQARVMQIMPLVFTAFFFLFPAGLVLYWLTNTALSIAQQWRINKIVAREAGDAV
jgi:YidC/Oxa1 family membrane protein insertase